MDHLARFQALIKSEMAVTMATGVQGSVTMRAVSPVPYGGDILIFTSPDSRKFAQLKENGVCCLAVGPFFVEAAAELRGATMTPENAALRAAYCEKFPGAFDEGIAFGGREDEFVLLRPTRLSGWAFPNDEPTPDGVPTIPFSIDL